MDPQQQRLPVPTLLPWKGRLPDVADDAFIAPTAVLIGDVAVGPGSGVFYGTVVRGDRSALCLGEGSNLQDNCTVHSDPEHPCTIGDRVSVGHAAVLHGCTVEDDVLIGMSATVLSRSRVGKGSIVGGGAVVLEGQELPEFSLAAGVPAKVKRTLEPDTYEDRLRHAAYYVELGQRAANGLVPVERDSLA